MRKTRNNRKSVKFNLRKNKTRKYNKKDKIVRKKGQKKGKRRTNKQVQRRQRRQRRQLRKSMKGGAIPFSEISEVYDNLKYNVTEAVDIFRDNPTSAPNNPESSNVNPSVDKQFIRTEAISEGHHAPNIGRIYDSAYS